MFDLVHAQHARLPLELLLAETTPAILTGGDSSDVDWDAFCRVARDGVVLVRVAERLERDDALAAPLQEALVGERERITNTLELIYQLTDLLEQEGIEFVFHKAFQHFPDMGHDVDLFVTERSRRVDTVIERHFEATPTTGSALHRLAGKTGYSLGGFAAPVEINHGRMGIIGDCPRFADRLGENRKRVSIGGVSTFVPSAEDQLITQVLQRMYVHRSIRVSDAVFAAKLFPSSDLDWDYLVRTCKRAGIFSGFRCYLGQMDRIHDSVLGRSFVPEAKREFLPRTPFKSVSFSSTPYRLPPVSVGGRLYLGRLLTEGVAMNIDGVGRLLLLPAFAVLAAIRKLATRPASTRVDMG